MMKMMTMKKVQTMRLRMTQGGESKTCRYLLEEEMYSAKFYYTTQNMLPALRISAFAEAILDSFYASSHQLFSRACTEQSKDYKESSAIKYVQRVDEGTYGPGIRKG